MLEAAIAVVAFSAVPVKVTPIPCNSNGTCPYYWLDPSERNYGVAIGGDESFVFQNARPPACVPNSGCAVAWNVEVQSFTSAAVDFAALGKPLQVEVTPGAKLASTPFNSPRVVSRFGRGSPTIVSTSGEKLVFEVSSPGHYSVELYGENLTNPLLVFIDGKDEECAVPGSGGVLYRFTGPGVDNPENPSWAGTGYYAFDSISVGVGDVVCIERGAYVQGHILPKSNGVGDGPPPVVMGAGVLSGVPWQTPKDDQRALL
eukprot:Hpha_TRINITY_DN4040_c0_g1::TRINITY_DN4040_c0_g1_i1::g.63727::m.63727